MRRVMLYNTMRLNSQRVPRKMLESIGDCTLAERAVQMMLVCREFGVTPIAGVCWTDAELIAICERNGIEVHVRDERSRDGEDVEDAYWDVPTAFGGQFDWMVMINLCHPFLRRATLEVICRAALVSEVPLVTVRRQRGLIWNAQQELLLGQGTTANTKTNPEYFVLAHVAYLCPVAACHDTKALNTSLELLELDLQPGELIDIDVQSDLEAARIYERGLRS